MGSLGYHGNVMMFNQCFTRGAVFCVAICCAWFPGSASAAEVVEAVFKATDTPVARTDDSPAVREMLDRVAWEPVDFEVRCTSTPGLPYDALVRFDSPLPSGKQWIDRVVMRWYAARDTDGQPIEAPAVLMLHTIQNQMLISNQVAQVFADRGIHTFLLQLPGYGERWDAPGTPPGVTAMVHGQQAVMDCLRARDAIAVLPNIKPGPIALQGTSLGGFVAATAGGIEPSFDPVILLISGGDSYGALVNGKNDAMQLRVDLARAGYVGQGLRNLLEPVEPLHVAHRLDPDRTWLISARDDVTIPRASSDALADAIGLDEQHRLWLHTNHYTVILMLPGVSHRMADIVLNGSPDAAQKALGTKGRLEK